MSFEGQVSRLNILLEFFARCAAVADIDGLLRLVGTQLRWVIDFDGWGLALTREGPACFWAASALETQPHRLGADELGTEDWALLRRVAASGVTELQGQTRHLLGVPLESAGRVLGALSLRRDGGSYTPADLRLMHHVGRYLGTLCARMQLETDARQLSERKDEVLALLGHELRNPLAPILTAVELLKRREPAGASRELKVIERQAQHLVRLVDDLLDVARLTRGDIGLKKAPVEVATVVTRAIEMSNPLFEQQRHFLRNDVPATGLCVDGDEHRLAQVLGNLLNNSARYTDAGGQVSIEARREGALAVIDVVDDGIGISAEALPTIFEVFARHPQRSAERGGLGLGLAVVKQLVELHGGTVSASSAGPGRGATFSVGLPCLPAGYVLPRPVSLRPAALNTGGTERVLLVDDNADAIDLFAAVLRAAGHRVAIAPDGPRALALLEEFRPSVAVLDLGMPVMDGFELAEQIQCQLGAEQPYLIALTGYGQERDRARSRAAGFAVHLVKPVSAEQLLCAVSESPGSRP